MPKAPLAKAPASEAPAAKVSTLRVIAEAVHAYPAVKFAFGLAAVLSAVGLAYFFGVGVKLAILSSIPSIALLIALWLFAHARHHAPIDFELEANVLVQVSLAVFTVVVVVLFATLIYGVPRTLKKIESVATFAIPHTDTDLPVLLADTDSEWLSKPRKAGEVCRSQLAIYEERYPSYNIDVAVSSNQMNDGEQTLYRYHCEFTATPK